MRPKCADPTHQDGLSISVDRSIATVSLGLLRVPAIPELRTTMVKPPSRHNRPAFSPPCLNALLAALLLFLTSSLGAAEGVAGPTTTSGPDGPKADANAIADQLANPVAKLVSVPFQFNYDGDIGTRQQGHMVSMKFQPVMPVSVNNDWNLIARPIVTTEWQTNIDGLSGIGVGPIAIETFFSPADGGRGSERCLPHP